MAIKLPPDTSKRLRASVQRYVRDELDQDIGDLKADLLLDFILKEVGPSIYNQAISEAQTHLAQHVADLEGVCYEKEFGYWKS